MLVEPHHVTDVVAFRCSRNAEAIPERMPPVDAGDRCVDFYQTYAGGMPCHGTKVDRSDKGAH